MSPEMQAVLVNALSAARPLVATSLRSMVACACPIGRDGCPDRTRIDAEERDWIEQHEALLAQIDAALDVSRGTVQ